MAMMRVSLHSKLSNYISSYNSMTNLMNMGHSSVGMPKLTRLFSLHGGRKNQPETTKFHKQHKGRMKGISSRGNHISFGTYALQALEPAWITARQIEAGRRAMTQNLRRGVKIWVRVFPDKPVTTKPAETRMGSGKGSHEYWAAVVKPGRILYEISGISEAMAKTVMSIASSKMPIRTQFVIHSREVILDGKENAEDGGDFIGHIKYSDEHLDLGEKL